ncbi:MAG: helix-hairpin-helix domain-containing protein [Bacillota bacterium]
MLLKFMGKETEIKTEAVIVAAACLVLLGCLSGYAFFSNKGDIIIESGAGTEPAESGTGATPGAEAVTASPQSAGEQSGATIQGTGTGQGDTAGIAVEAGGDVAGFAAEAGENAAGTGSARKPAELIKVYVVGCVNNPGIVTIEKGQLIDDAVKKAGGPTKEADLDNINMVYALNENVMLRIKSKSETAREQEQAKDSGIAPVTGKSGAGSGAAVIKGSGSGAVITGDDEDSGESAGTSGGKSLVNINTASIAELDTLPGIGEATAKEIIAYREKHGGFKKIEDIMKVPRIKQNRFQSIKDYITVD